MPPSPSALEPASFAYEPGDVVAGKYALEQLLGTGGMGAVFRARNIVIDMPVAIKVIRADLDRALLSGRLLQEARAAAKLSHPAIVRVFDVGQTALGDPFIVMELLEGETLASVIQREGRLTSVRAVQLLLPIADALSVAHAKGFVHRDVKPDNVFVANDQEGQLQPKLVDFGIVKHDEKKPGDSQLTQAGAVVGSPDYMSPEQARGLDGIDLRSDVWSFSIVLYEAITGKTPFESENYNALLRLIVETEPISLREQSAADAVLSAIVSKGMSKDPAGRWPSLGHMGKALASWLHDEGVNEDACGASLEARWLSRPSDPSGLGRVSRSSIPDGWPEPPSGVRATTGKLGYAPTVRLGKSAGTPHALSQTKSLAGSPGRHRLLALVAAATVGVCGLVAYGFLRSAPRERAVAPHPTVAAPSEARPELHAVSASPAAPHHPTPSPRVVDESPAGSPSALQSKRKTPPAPRTTVPPAPSPAPAPAPAPAAPLPPKPANDLLSPY